MSVVLSLSLLISLSPFSSPALSLNLSFCSLCLCLRLDVFRSASRDPLTSGQAWGQKSLDSREQRLASISVCLLLSPFSSFFCSLSLLRSLSLSLSFCSLPLCLRLGVCLCLHRLVAFLVAPQAFQAKRCIGPATMDLQSVLYASAGQPDTRGHDLIGDVKVEHVAIASVGRRVVALRCTRTRGEETVRAGKCSHLGPTDARKRAQALF